MIRRPASSKIELRVSRESDAKRLFDIWAAAVDATHDFLDAKDRLLIEPEVLDYVSSTPLWVAVTKDDLSVAFMGLTGSSLDSLFIHPDWHRRGLGSLLIRHAMRTRSLLTTDVNEQNPSATAFYERLGFVRTGRSEDDGSGRPYPLIHMRLERLQKLVE